jgi:hypothetical protein
MTSPESNFSATVKTARGSLVTVRGDDADHFVLNTRAAVIAEIGAEVQMLEDTILGGGTATPVTAAPAAQASAAPTMVAAAAPQALEIVTGKYGDTYTYGHPDAPTLPDGRGAYILREWVAKSGKKMRAWVDPIKGPKPASRGAEEAPLVWAN